MNFPMPKETDFDAARATMKLADGALAAGDRSLALSLYYRALDEMAHSQSRWVSNFRWSCAHAIERLSGVPAATLARPGRPAMPAASSVPAPLPPAPATAPLAKAQPEPEPDWAEAFENEREALEDFYEPRRIRR